MTKVIIDIAEYESLRRGYSTPVEPPMTRYERADKEAGSSGIVCFDSDADCYYVERYEDNEGQD